MGEYVSTEEMSVKRELAMRERVYPRWVANGKMTQEKAKREIEVMQEVLRTLENLVPVIF